MYSLFIMIFLSVVSTSSGCLVTFHRKNFQTSLILLTIGLCRDISLSYWTRASRGSSWCLEILSFKKCLMELILLVIKIGGRPTTISADVCWTLKTAPIADLIILYQTCSVSVTLRLLIHTKPAYCIQVEISVSTNRIMTCCLKPQFLLLYLQISTHLPRIFWWMYFPCSQYVRSWSMIRPSTLVHG